ncbi:MAG: Hpt domain-containing protein [Nitrospirae bacterium]|nr:Hpt domain-containing protein [Nitrospirota bacterium]
MAEGAERIIVTVDSELVDLIPGYLINRRGDIEKMNAAIDSGEFEAIRVIGHQLKGSGGGYGFDFISDTGMALERGAKENNYEEIKKHIAALGDYLNRLETVYG